LLLTAKEQALLEALEERAAEHDIEVVTIELTGAKKAPTIRVYLDAPEGVGFDELASSQQWINEVLDALDPFPGAYTLEVSSPGIDRPLRTRMHFERALGETVFVQTKEPLDGRSRWTGILKAVEEGKVLLEPEGGVQATQEIGFDQMRKAHVKGRIDFGS
jgi:ribosome maturation factor RimP